MTTTSDTIEPTSDTVPVVVRRASFRFRFLVAFLIGLLAALALGVGALYAYDQQHAGRILPGVRAGGVDLAGMTPDAAAARLNAALAGLSQGQVVLNTPSGPASLDYASIGRRADVGMMVTEAMAVGREGSPVERVIADARTAFRGVDLPIRVTYESAAVQD